MFRIPSNELLRNRRTIKLQRNCRISNICGRLLSVRGKYSNGVTYSLLVDSGAAINIIKRNDVPKEVRVFSIKKYFVMGKDKIYCYDATYVNYFGKKHLFYIVENDFPLAEAGIIRLPFFRKHERYSITLLRPELRRG